MSEVLSTLRSWFSRTIYGNRRFAVETCDDPPEETMPFVLYLIGDERKPWSAALVCPCGCAQTIALSLIRDDDPSWRIQRHRDGSLSLFPSVWRTKGCRSHFFIRSNSVVWALDIIRRRSNAT